MYLQDEGRKDRLLAQLLTASPGESGNLGSRAGYKDRTSRTCRRAAGSRGGGWLDGWHRRDGDSRHPGRSRSVRAAHRPGVEQTARPATARPADPARRLYQGLAGGRRRHGRARGPLLRSRRVLAARSWLTWKPLGVGASQQPMLRRRWTRAERAPRSAARGGDDAVKLFGAETIDGTPERGDAREDDGRIEYQVRSRM